MTCWGCPPVGCGATKAPSIIDSGTVFAVDRGGTPFDLVRIATNGM